MEDFVDQLLSKEAGETPCDVRTAKDLVLVLPKWFNEEKFNQARRFYWHNCYGLTLAMLLGLVNVLAVPSILKILLGARRSNDVYPAFKRYLSTFLHAVSWFETDLKPGSYSWESVYKVRKRHILMTKAAMLKGHGIICQRDLALTLFGFVGLSFLKPDKFGIETLEEDDWDAYNQFWRVIGYMIGIEERYNICRSNVEETRQVCRLILHRVYTPCLSNPPEYFEYMAHIMLEGVSSANPTVNTPSLLYWTKYLAEVPGYVYTEGERIQFQQLLRNKLNGRSEDTGVDSSTLMSKPFIEKANNRLLFVRDYDSFETIPEYRELSMFSRFKLLFNSLFTKVYTTYYGRRFLNTTFLFIIKLMKEHPKIIFFMLHIKVSARYLFNFPLDNSGLKPNSAFNKTTKSPWYKTILSYLYPKKINKKGQGHDR
ncbi:PREDICTED: uncharacterized protein LOC106106850 isoform X2 [Papilio polytes]|uniref:uncharacterized protein LOC106106850 isoform X2 n=1 Tax=Papilio polytes TaxID=76194 RepID=UPI000675D764|nr:PREDICTED: uncharacterized protein LOC106106850 isoform X2 [Papilio polytes]